MNTENDASAPYLVDVTRTRRPIPAFLQNIPADFPPKVRQAWLTIHEHLQTAPDLPQNLFLSSTAARDWLRARFLGAECEAFGVLFLDKLHYLIVAEEMFRGNANSTMIHIREIAKRALQLNASSIILYHNHPTGHPQPSRADIELTKDILATLKPLDITVLDHIVIGRHEAVSIVESGLI